MDYYSGIKRNNTVQHRQSLKTMPSERSQTQKATKCDSHDMIRSEKAHLQRKTVTMGCLGLKGRRNRERLLNRDRFLLRVIKMFWDQTVVTSAQHSEYNKNH